MTRQDAIHATGHTEFHHHTRKNADGTPARCRVNGQCKIWKTRPLAFRLPVKYGMYDCFYITENNMHEWRTA